MRYAYAMTAAMLLGGTAATLALQSPASSQEAQNEPGTIAAANAPRAGAPMSFADLAARLQPAVVNISTTQKVQVANNNPFAGTPFGDLFGGGDNGGRPVTREAQSLGSGFVISSDGYIVTNNHVVSPGQRGAAVSSITVTFPDRTEYPAKLIGRDPTSDLAVLKIEGKNLPFVKFGDSARTRVGDWVVAIGNPYGLGGTVTAGIVSALHRNINGGPSDRYIQTDASINQGNSGGPMFDMAGNVIGINNWIVAPSGGNIGIGFAIPSASARPIVERLIKGQAIERGYLGISIQPVSDEIADSLGLPHDRGELVRAVIPDLPAAAAGIKVGDIVMKVNNQEVTPDRTLSGIVSETAPGTRIPIEVLRSGKTVTVYAVVAKRPNQQELAKSLDPQPQGNPFEGPQSQGEGLAESALGLRVLTMNPDYAAQLGVPAATKGVVIAGIDPASDAANRSLQRRDIIVSANMVPVASVQDLDRAVREAKSAGRPTITLQVMRPGQAGLFYIALRIN